ncbi:hypothetical protein DPO11_26905, partial [Salmonella enterica]|nr:hypothetical protein [Salmonella enterica]
TLGGSGDDWNHNYTTKGGGWILDGATVNKSGNISLQGVGFVNSSVTAGQDLTINNEHASLTVQNTTLNATKGNISLNATVEGGNALMVSGSNITAGNNISLNGTATNGTVSAVSLDNADMTASSGNISVTGTGWDSGNGALYVNGGNFSAQNTVMEGTAGRNNVGAKLAGNINVTQGNLAVTGTMKQSGKGSFTGLLAQSGLNVNVSAGNLSLNGKVEKFGDTDGLSGSTALNLTNTTLSAQHADLKGSNVFSGRGFVLSNVTLAGSLANAANMTFSSEGSAGTVSNIMDMAGGMTLTAFNNLAGIDNDTLVSVISVSEEELKKELHFTDTGDWSFNGSVLNKVSSGKSGKWMVGSLSGVNASTTGNIALTGVNLVDGNLTGRSISLAGAASTPLTVMNTSLNATSGGVSLNNTGGKVGVTGSNLSATGGDIILKATNGVVATKNSNLTATGGNISIEGNLSRTDGGTLVDISGGKLDATGDITVSGREVGNNDYYSSVKLTDVVLNGSSINVTSTPRLDPKTVQIALSNATLQAVHDIALNAATSGLGITITNHSVLNSTGGNVSIVTNNRRGWSCCFVLTISDSNISAASGISLSGLSAAGGGNRINGVSLSKVNMTVAQGNISVTGQGAGHGQPSDKNPFPDAALYVADSNFSAQNTLLEGSAWGGKQDGVELAGNISVTTGNLAVNGEKQSRGNGGHAGVKGLTGLNLTVTSGELNLNGSVGEGGGEAGSTGLELNDAILSASRAVLAGSSAKVGSGFVLNNVTLKGGIESGANTTFSSAGSADAVTNLIGKNTLNATTAQVLMNTGIENFTQIDGSLVSDVSNPSGDDWVHDYSSSKGGGWIFNGVNVSKTGNITLTGAGFTNSTVTAGQNLSLNATNGSLRVADSKLVATAGNISLNTATETLTVSNVTLESGGGETTLSGTSAKEAGVKLMNTVNVTKGNLTVNGTSTAQKEARGIDARGATLSVSESGKKLTMNGHVDNGTGIDLSGSSSLNASSATLNGTSQGTGSGFLLNSDLQGNLATNGALVLKSTGSGENVVNQIGTGVNTTVVKHMIETNTSIGSHTDVLTVNLYGDSDFTTWKNGGTNLNKDFGDFGLRFSNISLSADSINLSGASFTDSSLTATAGDLTIDNRAGAVGLANTSLNASAGNVTLTGNAGISLSGTRGGIDAGKDISLKASAGKVDIAGVYKTESKVTSLDKPVNITSTGGNISVVATNPQEGNVNAIDLKGVNMTATAGGISLNGTVPNGALHSFGVNLQDVTLKTRDNITVDANSTGIAIAGRNVSFDAGDSVLVNGTGRSSGYSYAAVPFTNSSFKANNTIAFEAVDNNEADAQVQSALGFYGDTTFEAKQTSLKGRHLNPGKNTSFTSIGVALTGQEPCCNEKTGTVTVTGGFSVDGSVNDSGAGVVIGANLSISGKADIKGHSQSGEGVAFTTTADSPYQKVALNISAGGGGSITGTSVSGAGMRSQNTGNVVNISTGSGQELVLGGESSTGPGVALGGHISRVPQPGGANAGGSVVFSGKSQEGNGVKIFGGTKLMQLLVNGESAGNGNGIELAKSADVEGGALDGLSQKGAGVKLGGDNTLTDVTVNGRSTSGSGVDISGVITGKGSTTITGNSGSGAGVNLDGIVTGVRLTGKSVSGPGMRVTDDSNLNGAVVSTPPQGGSGMRGDEDMPSADGGTTPDGGAPKDQGTEALIRQVHEREQELSRTDTVKGAWHASGYRAPAKPVSVEICTADGQCRTLNAGETDTPQSR